MSVWFVHRRDDGSISWAGQYVQPGYADEQLDDATSAELHTFLNPPLVPPKPTPREWLERLAPATQLALETAALANAQVALWLRKATGAGSIDVTLAETQQGVTAMVAAGLLTAAEQTTLLAP
jgi:hypothetical protein